MLRVGGHLGASERCQGAGSCSRWTGGTPSSSPSLEQGNRGAEGPSAFALRREESKGHTVGKGRFGAESVSASVHQVASGSVFSRDEKSL